MAADAPAKEAASAERLLQQANSRHLAGDLQGAVAGYRKFLDAAPHHAPAWSNLGLALHLLGDAEGAIEACRRAIADARNANAFNNLGLALLGAYRPREAIEAYRRALAIDSDFHECWCNLGQALAAAKEPAEAVAAFRRTLEIVPDHAVALVHLVFQNQQQCAWEDFETGVERLRRVAGTDSGEVNPFGLLAISDDPLTLREVTRNFARRVANGVAHLPRPRRGTLRRAASDRLRVGYLTANMHDHAVAVLAAELFERHDRSRFEVTSYSYGPDDGSAMRARLQRAFERFVDIRTLSTASAAQRIADDGIDILVDLMGYTQGARTGILALRPAPIQVAYLGYPGPMNAGFIDYSIVDRFTVPAADERHFDEALVVLPGCYQPNDSRRAIAREAGSRADHGLPADGVVFCCFCQPYKITLEVFGWWVALLLEVPDSVLWLLSYNRDARANLRREATNCGIAADRLVFAEHLPLSRHLARSGHADLFLDTWPYGGHTTASDALWAGVPVLTCPGATFASRVAGSLLSALGLDELIAPDPEAYFENARRLAMERSALVDLRARLKQARAVSDLFSGGAAARKLEAAFTAIWERQARGLPPALIDLAR